MRIVYYVSGHGLGHATRSYPIIESLLQKGFRITLVCSRSLFVFDDLQSPNFDFRISDIVDPGVIQSDAVTLDCEQTFKKQREYWKSSTWILEAETKWLRSLNPCLALLDAPPYPALACKVSLY